MGKISPVMRQYMAVTCFSLMAFSFGNSLGWGTINFVELQQENTTFPTGPFSLEEATFVATSMGIGGLVGNFAVVPIAKRFGTVGTLCLMGIPQIITYLLIIFAQNKYHVYIARIICGFAGSASMVTLPTMIAEIAFVKIRGSLNCLLDPANNFGVMLAYLLGGYFNPIDQAKFMLIVPIVFVILALFLPQTPDYWIEQNKQKRAEKSQKFYKGKDAVAHIEALLPAANGTKEKPAEHPTSTSLTLADFLTPEARKSIGIILMLLVLPLLSGHIFILDFVTSIFVDTGSSLSPADSSIIVTIIQITADVVVFNVVDRIKRRDLLIISSITTAIAYLTFGIYCMFFAHTPGLDWLPQLFMGVITFAGCMGVLPIPHIITTEILPDKIRPTCLAVTTSLMWVIFFVIGSVFPMVQALYGLHVCLFFFGTFSSLLALYTYHCVPETMGKTSEQIMEMIRN